ncbi:protein takeout-like [Anthonomus grandis grandis]|uniref:protein takeout-like n=1 Tax=Anthonomus grandis grandis TaxID=2921223 RepID=UPI002166442B|nr:protein takeout-like [Anthonomus grandis grandis]
MAVKCWFVFIFVLNVTGAIWGYNVQDAPLLVKRPPWLKACKKSDENVNKCINDMFLKMFPSLAVGIPEINVEHFEPLSLDAVSISKGNGAIVLTGSLYDLNVAGPSNSTPRDTSFTINDDKHGHWNFKLDIPLLDLKSKYNLKGQILVLPLLGQGNCDMKMYDIRTRIFTNITFLEKEGREVMHIDSMKVKFRIGGLKVKFDNLFNGNKVLGHTVNSFINQNGLEIVAELEENLGNSLALIFMKLINNIFTKIPIDLWYLSDEQYKQYEEDLQMLKLNS